MNNLEQKVGRMILRLSQPWYAVVGKQTSPDGRLHEVLALHQYKGEAENKVFLWNNIDAAVQYEVVPVMLTLTEGASPK